MTNRLDAMRIVVGAIVCVTAAAALAQGPQVIPASPPPAPAPPPVLAIENVTVIPMDRERTLKDHTVVIEGRRITAVGPSASTKVPDGATRIDGRGKFLMPGLTEMHAHFLGPQQIQSLGEAVADRFLYLNVACGVTTVRGMIGGPRDLQMREEIARGLRIGPRIFTAGPSVNGTSVPDARAAWRAVTEQRAAGYDLLKIHPGVPLPAFDEVVRTAKAEGIPFAGHIPAAVGLLHALESGIRTVEHLDGFIEALQKEGSKLPEDTGFFGSEIAGSVDEARIPALVAKVKAAGAWNTPTQVLLDNLFAGPPLEEIAARPEMKYVPPAMLGQWKTGAGQFRGPAYDAAAARRFVDLRRKLIRALRDGGAGLVLGADAPQVFNVPGFATLRELESMVAAGLTPYQALETGTRNPPIALGVPGSFGTSRPAGARISCCWAPTRSRTSATSGSGRAWWRRDATSPPPSWTRPSRSSRRNPDRAAGSRG